MSNVEIPQIPGVAIGLDGNELMELVQGGVSKQAKVGLIAGLAGTGDGTAQFVLVNASPIFPNSRGLSVEANVLTLVDGGPQGSLFISIEANGVTNAKLALMADQTLKGNISGMPATPVDVSIAQIFGAASQPINVIAGGVYNVPLTALSIIINKTDGANVVLPAIATKVGPVKIIGAQATAHPFNVTVTDGTIIGLSSYPFTSDYQSVTFSPYVAGTVWTT